ncbi:hypothetical protein [Cryobacterium arcticum]|uniref:Uncharacterized protein n=1 Tax=Cryobacterium arcticum TaxID=670052 RepID=A0A317ZPI4_9MICO|nr:hypothetical protein [Cryobacterium arcticum]PXA68376.1 hypothetical protein CTB96_17340 [Cryobacterium arcticum]
MVIDVASLTGARLALPGVGPILAYLAVVLLCALLPFVLSFAADAGLLMLRRGRSVLPLLLTAAVCSLFVAATGFLLLELGLSLGGNTAAASSRLAEVAERLLLVCLPLAVLTVVVRQSISGLRHKAQSRRSAEVLYSGTETGQLAGSFDYVR